MPPPKKRARTYDPVRIRKAVLAQLGPVRAAVRTLNQLPPALRPPRRQ